MANPLLSDRFVDFLLHDVLDVSALTALPHFEERGFEVNALALQIHGG